MICAGDGIYSLFYRLTVDLLTICWYQTVILHIYTKEYHAPCEHDRGVPLIQDNTVVGLFSLNRGCGANTIASIFTNVSAHSEWLLETAEAQPSTCIATTRTTTMATVTSEAPPSCDSISNMEQIIAEDDCLPPACTFVCPLPNGNFPIGPDACSSQYYLCVQCKPILQVYRPIQLSIIMKMILKKLRCYRCRRLMISNGLQLINSIQFLFNQWF